MHLNKKAIARANIREQKEMRKRIDKLLASGPGFQADQELRYYLHEYNQRLMYGRGSQPSSFRVMSSFFNVPGRGEVFELKPELDHLIRFADFMDFATSADAPPLEAMGSSPFPVGVIHSYTSLDKNDEFILSTEAGLDFTIGSISVVNTGAALNVVVVAGFDIALAKQYDGRRIDDELGRMKTDNPDLQFLAELNKDAEEMPVLFRGDPALIKVNALATFDPHEKQFVRRMICRDLGNKFDVELDDPVLTGNLPNEAKEHLLNEIADHQPLFDLMKYVVLLPAYFAFRVDVVVREEYKPRLTPISSGDSPTNPEQIPEPHVGSMPGEPLFNLRRVAAIRKIGDASQRAARRICPPEYKVHVQGFYRKLEDGATGFDEQGNPTKGRTWIRAHERWRDLPGRPKDVFLKSRVAAARMFAESERLLTEISPSPEFSLAKEADPSPSTISREEAYQERKKLTSRVRYAVLCRDEFRCVICGSDASRDNSIRLEVDHVVPVAKGGKTIMKNLRTLCRACNNGKSDLLYSTRTG